MKQYLDLLEKVLTEGERKIDRTGTGTLSIFGHQMRFDLAKGFPMVTTKQVGFKSILSELLWFVEGSTDERRLAEIYYDKPREELIDKTTIWTANADSQGVAHGFTNNDVEKQLGRVYGAQWRGWEDTRIIDGTPEHTIIDQIASLIHEIKTNPSSRRLILSAWNVGEIDEMSLPPCHCFAQFMVVNGKLSCQVYIRSNDLFLGAPYNIASYALLTHMIAQVCGLGVGELVYTIGDAHIYLNATDQTREQLRRKPYPLPVLSINESIDDIDDFSMRDFELIGYQRHGSIHAEMAV